MLRPNEKLDRDLNPDSARPSSGRLGAALVLFTSLLSACVPQGDLSIKDSDSDSVAASERDDTGTEDDQQKDSGNDSATDTDDTSETGDTDTSEPYDPESVVDVIGTWPTDATIADSIEFGGDLRADYPSFEPSGITHDGLESRFYLVGDDGDFVILGEDGGVSSYWDSGTGGVLDLEGVAMDPATGFVYLGDEATSSVLEFDPDAESLTGESCSFSDLSTDIANGLGMEGLAFVPSEYAPSTWPVDSMGYFIAGSQYVSELKAFPASECVGEIFVTSIATLPSSNTDVSGLTFNEDTRRLYVLHDYSNTLDLMKLDGTVVTTYELPVADASLDEQREGVWVNATDCANNKGELVIANDNTSGYTNNAIISYQDFLITCR